MSRAIEGLRIVAGALVFISGLMGLGLFGFEPPVAEPNARAFQLAMHGAGYFLPIVTAVFLISGLSFLLNRFAAFSAILLAPVSANILLFHTILGAGELPAALLLSVINGYMLWYCRAAYAPLLRPKI